MKKNSIEILLSSDSRARGIISVQPTDAVEQAAKLMTKHNVGLVLVLDGKKLVGVLSERDIVGKWVGGQRFPAPITVSEIMTRDVEVVTADDTVYDCYLRFIARKCRHLPVLDPFGEILGVLSMRDVTAYVVNELSELTENGDGKALTERI